jgi:L-fuconolactonase
LKKDARPAILLGTNPRMKTLNRRTFLQTTAAATIGGTFGLSPALDAAEPGKGLRPSLIIDTHTHFYDPKRPQGVPWPNKEDALLYRTVLPAHYKALPKPQAANGTVVVEASKWVDDNRWILDLAKDDPFIVGFVGNLSVADDQFEEHLDRFAANPLFRGIRIGQDLVLKSTLNPDFLANVKLIAGKDLQIDVLGNTTMLPAVETLAKAVPDLRIVIDHVANLKIDGNAPDPAWLKGMAAAAKHKHVYCKVSGLVEGSGKKDGTAPRELAFYRPVLDAVWENFGADRVIYGSNWPVSERFATCATVQSIVTEYFQGKGQEALDKYFWKNAQAVYKWVKR